MYRKLRKCICGHPKSYHARSSFEWRGACKVCCNYDDVYGYDTHLEDTLIPCMNYEPISNLEYLKQKYDKLKGKVNGREK